jgi:anhydro-N-acetylmuramic acid kinase
LTYYNKKPPKSLGIEWVREYIFPLLQHDTLENLLNTFCHHIARQITDTLKVNFQNSSSKTATMLVTGGGAKNLFLMELLKSESGGNWEIFVPNVEIIEFKEAIIFAFLGLLRMLGEVNTLQSVTGAKTSSSGGLIYDQIPALNFP